MEVLHQLSLRQAHQGLDLFKRAHVDLIDKSKPRK